MSNESGDPKRRYHEHVEEPTVGDAILDRLVHNAHKIELKGESMRKKSSQKGRK